MLHAAAAKERGGVVVFPFSTSHSPSTDAHCRLSFSWQADRNEPPVPSSGRRARPPDYMPSPCHVPPFSSWPSRQVKPGLGERAGCMRAGMRPEALLPLPFLHPVLAALDLDASAKRIADQGEDGPLSLRRDCSRNTSE